MSQIILDPPKDKKDKWGVLAHVPDWERERILGLPFGQFKPMVKLIEKELKQARKVKPISGFTFSNGGGLMIPYLYWLAFWEAYWRAPRADCNSSVFSSKKPENDHFARAARHGQSAQVLAFRRVA